MFVLKNEFTLNHTAVGKKGVESDFALIVLVNIEVSYLVWNLN